MKQVLTSWEDPDFAIMTSELYGGSLDVTLFKERMQALFIRHESLVGTKPTSFYSTPGRTELAGNHTDHNKGQVLTASIQLDIMASVSVREAQVITLWEPQFGEITVFLDQLEPIISERNTTQSLVRGISAIFHKRGLKIGGFNASLDSQVLVGSGLSSSAAIEVLIASILNEEFNDGSLSPLELAIIGQEAENVYFGKPSGLMDQAACASGGIIGLDFKHSPPDLDEITFDFTDHGYTLAIVNTRGSHADLTPSYAAIPTEMRLIAQTFGKKTLDEIPAKDFYNHWDKLKKTLSHRAILRAHHFFSENERVCLMGKALLANDMETYLSLVQASGASSAQWLQNLYAEGSPSEQSLNLGLAMTEHLLSANSGAWRVHGGGFAGTIQVYVPLMHWEIFQTTLDRIFGKGGVIPLTIRSRPCGRFAHFSS